MLVNLSNHPVKKWSEKQLEMGKNIYGEIVDEPFPLLQPSDSLDDIKTIVKQKIDDCLKHQKDNESFAIHIMGEFIFTYQFVKEMEKKGVECVASTTDRAVTDNPDGTKTSVFTFVRFRPYY